MPAFAMHQHHLPPVADSPPLLDLAHLTPFVDPLPVPEIAKPLRAGNGHYQIPIREFTAKIHRDVPATRFWGYGNSVPGPTIEVRTGVPVTINWLNQLPPKHFLPIDHNLMGAEAGLPESRTVVHVHGARVPPASDGYPEDWYGPGNSRAYTYPNHQDASMLWYHDHTMGINRLNICAGMAGLYIIRDHVEDALNLPKAEFEIPLVLMDRMITKEGQLYYPHSQVAGAPWVAEYLGDATLVNGKLLPCLDVQPRKYRFRILNASNARFYFLTLDNKLPMHQIGSDQGLLSAPVQVPRVTLAPGERADVVIDFSDAAGQSMVLNNLSVELMQIRVSAGKVEDESALPKTLRPVTPILETSAVRTRRLSLDEYDNLFDEPITHLLDGKRWHDPISEKPLLNSTEIWEFLNTTEDTHPIHLHLVRFQILDRRVIAPDEYIYKNKKVVYLSEPVPPEPWEAGWKDTVRATPGAATRIIVNFNGYPGRYVWHCHILEHEDNEMMRPFEVVSP
jgi:spore coat protein A